MRINNITISAGLLLASASAVSVRSQTKGSGLANTISDIGNWLENAGQDIGDFFENDFVDFFEETIPNTAMSGIDWFETTGLYAAGDSVVDWVGDTSNWEALGKTLLSSTLTGFSGDWEGGWDMFTDSSMYYSNTYDEIEALQAQAEAYEELMAEIAEYCADFTPAVGEVGESRYTYTSDFNYELSIARINPAVIYDYLGPIGTDGYTYIDSRSCEADDCMHPCYGDNQFGACNKCAEHLMTNEGERHSVCDLCVLGQ